LEELDMRQWVAALAGLALAFLVAAPVAANTSDRFQYDDVFQDQYSCGAVLTTRVHADGTASFAADGTWRSTMIRFRYDGDAVDPATGQSIALRGRQVLTEQGDTATTRGQGVFIRVGGRGVVLMDVGRLVFRLADGGTVFASAHVLRFDDPEAEAKVDAAVCSLFDA
jgi:hypothetical protein